MENSVKNVAEKFKAWQKRISDAPEYCCDEINHFTDSLTRGELLEVFVWLAKCFPDYRPEYIGGANLEMDIRWMEESLTTQPAVGSFIKKAEADLNKRIAGEHELFEELQEKALQDAFTPKEDPTARGILYRLKP